MEKVRCIETASYILRIDLYTMAAAVTEVIYQHAIVNCYDLLQH